MTKSKSGAYGPNVKEWGATNWQRIRDGKFAWVLVRADSDRAMARRAQEEGLEVVVQFPDHFNTSELLPPGMHAWNCYDRLREFAPYSDLVVLDNEPNLHPEASGDWYAERFTRWYRAVAASFRFFDDAGHWQLIMPAMCPAPGRNLEYWHHINRENFLESEAIGVHCYWQDGNQLGDPRYGRLYAYLHRLYPGKPIYVLEYANSSDYATGEFKAREYAQFIVGLPSYVRAAFAFILAGTEEWQKFFLSDKELAALAKVAGS